MTGQENKALSRSNSNTSSGCWFLRKTLTGLLGVPDGEIREAISHSGDLVAWSSWKKKEYRKWEGETEPGEQEDMRIPTTGAEIWRGERWSTEDTQRELCHGMHRASSPRGLRRPAVETCVIGSVL